MSTYYLLDMHVPLANIYTDARIVDVVTTTTSTAEFRVDGLTPIRVPDGVRIVNPTNLQDIVDQKHTGLLALFPGFANIVFDDLLDATGIDPLNPTFLPFKKSGARSTVGGQALTVATPLGSVVTQCIPLFEAYTWRYVDPKGGRAERFYIEEPAELHDVDVSVDGGANFATTTSGVLTSFVLIQGSSLKIQFPGDFVNNRLLHIGSWAVIY